MSAEIISFENLKIKQEKNKYFLRWKKFYLEQPHDELLEALVYQHENDFPLRRSESVLEQSKHQALVAVLNEKAQTEFLKTFLSEIHGKSSPA